LTFSNGLALGPAENARAWLIKESWFFLELLAATFETMNLCMDDYFETLNYIYDNYLNACVFKS